MKRSWLKILAALREHRTVWFPERGRRAWVCGFDTYDPAVGVRVSTLFAMEEAGLIELVQHSKLSTDIEAQLFVKPDNKQGGE